MGGLGSKERTLSLLKDPTSGPIAITAVVLLLMLKLFSIETILQQGQLKLLIWPLVFGRIGVALLFVSTPYARKSGLGSAIAAHKQDKQIWLAAVLTVLISCYFLAWMVIPVLTVAGPIFWYLRSRMMKRLDGCTGDTAGALLEIIECACLLCLVACITN
jgi:adenosylcobinamide-GDP ribazoletransferase